MASPVAEKGPGPTLESCLAEARSGRPRPVYLLDGDAFLTGRAGRELAEALVPEARRSLNLVELDAAASPAEVAGELVTAGLFGGGKVVLLSEPTFLTSKEGQGEAFQRAREMWAQGRQREAARRLLAIAAKAGWSAQDLDPRGGEAPGAEEWKRELSVEWGEGDADFVAAAARFAAEREMKAARDDAAALDALLARGLPEGHVLVIAAGKVDGRLPLVKRLAAVGRRVGLLIPKEGRWDDERPVLGPTLRALLAGTGKRVSREAEARLAALVGGDARALASELSKLAAFVGGRPVIEADDVDRLVVRSHEDPFFALGNAVESRDLPGALAVLDRMLADGGSIHLAIGLLASAVRRMLEEKERARRVAGERRIGEAREWERLVFGSIPPEERGERKPFGFWMKYQASTRFSRGELLEGLADLAEADLAAKSGRDARVAVERLLLRLLAERGARGAA
jgi:DNA polymerase-3 subunit delta